MGRWDHRPKKIDLRYLLRDSECEFVFDASQTSVDEIAQLLARFATAYAPRQLRRGTKGMPGAKQILIVTEGRDCLSWIGWDAPGGNQE